MTDTAQDPTGTGVEASPQGPSAAPRVRRRVRTTAGDRERHRKVWTYGLLILSAILMANAVIGEKGYLANLQAQREYQEAFDSLKRLEAENARLLDETMRLKSDPRALEEAARLQLGLIKPGETLITLRDRPTSRD